MFNFAVNHKLSSHIKSTCLIISKSSHDNHQIVIHNLCVLPLVPAHMIGYCAYTAQASVRLLQPLKHLKCKQLAQVLYSRPLFTLQLL